MLNSKKCILCASFRILLGHVVCKEGILVDPAKIALIVKFPPPTNVKQLRVTLGNMGYYHNFIRGYATITTTMEKLLKIAVEFECSHEFQASRENLKNSMVTTLILVFLEWKKEFMSMLMLHSLD